MKKRIAMILILAMLAAVFTGCAGKTVVYYTECDCPEGAHTAAPAETPAEAPAEELAEEAAEEPTAEGALKTGLAIIGSAKDSEEAVKAAWSVNVVAVLVDGNGVIQDCLIDSLGAEVGIDAAGAITSDTAAEILTKQELGDDYGMVAYGGATYEWYEQANALAAYAIGKTAEELRSGAIDESGYAADADLATTATINLYGYVDAIEAACANAQDLGAKAGDELCLAISASTGKSAAVTEEADGTAQLDCTALALTAQGGVITSCTIDALQSKVTFGADGKFTSDTAAAMPTKNQLGADYGMVAWGGAIAEWDEQAASFAAYVTGKTADEVAGIAVTEGKPADADLATSVTISIGDFQSLVAKALQ